MAVFESQSDDSYIFVAVHDIMNVAAVVELRSETIYKDKPV